MEYYNEPKKIKYDLLGDKFMKYITQVLIVLVFAVCLTACSRETVLPDKNPLTDTGMPITPESSQVKPDYIMGLFKGDAAVDLWPVYRMLGMDNNYFENVRPASDIKRLSLRIGEKAEPYTVLCISNETNMNYQFLVFKEDKESCEFIGNINFGDRSGQGPDYRVVSIGDYEGWIVVETQAGYGTGFNQHNEVWYRITDSGIVQDLSYPVARIDFPPITVGPSYKMDGIVSRQSKAGGQFGIEVEYKILYYIEQSGGEEYLAPVQRSVGYYWDDAKKAFVEDKGNPEHQDFYFNNSCDNALVLNFKMLSDMANSGTEEQKKWLREFLKSCGDSREKSLLLELL